MVRLHIDYKSTYTGEYFIMRIVHITDVHQWSDVRIFHKMCRSLVQAGHEVHLVAANGPPEDRKVVEGVFLHLLPRPRGRMRRMLVTARQVLTKAANLKADLYHFHDPELLPFAYFFQRHVGRPVVYDAHEDYRVHMAKSWLPAWLHGTLFKVVGFVEDAVAPRLAGVVLANPPHENQSLLGLPNGTAILNYPLLSEFPIEDGTVGEHRPGLFAYIGALSRLRGTDKLIRTLPMLDDTVRLALAGTWESEAFQAECRALPGWSKVIAYPYLNRQEVGALLRQSQVGLAVLQDCPNYRNNYPTKIFEYMASGIPVITNDFPLYRSVVEESRCGLCVESDNIAAIAQAMAFFVTHPELGREMGANGRKAVLSTYSWETEAARLIAFYRDIVAAFPTGA